MKFKLILIILVILALIAVVFVVSTSKGGKKVKADQLKPINLTWWGVFHNSDEVAPLIDAYRALHPYVTIEYRKLRFEEYESEILNTLAEDRGPDIISLPNTYIGKYQTKLLPLPKRLQTFTIKTVGSIKKEQIVVREEKESLSFRELKGAFVSPVVEDVVRDGEIWALPLSLDTLVLFYNRDLLDKALIPEPPKSWSEFQDAVKKLTLINQKGQIVQSGASLGTANNVTRAADILALLMLQTGAEMVDQSGLEAIFDRQTEKDYNPGAEALRFYTDFANPIKEVYTWNESQPSGIDAFKQARAAFFFGYSYHLPIIRRDAPRLNFSVSEMPQPDGASAAINFTNYWVETVSRKTKAPQEAWDFLQFATTTQVIKQYLEKAGRAPALRGLLKTPPKEGDLPVFYSQVLTSQTWYRGRDPETADKALLEMITSVIRGEAEIQDAITLAAKKVTQTLR